MGQEKGFWNEAPEHAVRLSNGFWLGKYAVTQRQWRSVMKTDPSFFKGENRPVEKVSWNDCQEFIQKINSQLNCGARLPTEAEWEYACRAGTTGDYAGTGKLDDMGWYDDTILGLGLRTHPVGEKQSNAWGFYDMHGNVCEWCNDWYNGGYYTDCPMDDPQGPSSGIYRALRGGAWNNGAPYCRSSYRFGGMPDYHSIGCGFRLCCSAMP